MNEGVNRAFLYGESVFTTTLMVDGVLRDREMHFDRLKRGVEFVYGPFNEGADWARALLDRLDTRIGQESGDKVVRLTVYREQERGLRRSGLVSASELKIHLSSSPLDPSRSDGKAMRLRSCSAIMRPHWWPSFLKAGSYLDVILAQKVALGPGDDDLLFLSPGDTLLASSVASIFVVRHNKLYTAPTGPNVLEGVMRKKVLEAAHEFFDDSFESETTMEQALRADAMFGTNSVRGPFLIGHLDGREVPNGPDFLEKFEGLRKKVFG